LQLERAKAQLFDATLDLVAVLVCADVRINAGCADDALRLGFDGARDFIVCGAKVFNHRKRYDDRTVYAVRLHRGEQLVGGISAPVVQTLADVRMRIEDVPAVFHSSGWRANEGHVRQVKLLRLIICHLSFVIAERPVATRVSSKEK
jgi:hypothetical protein